MHMWAIQTSSCSSSTPADDSQQQEQQQQREACRFLAWLWQQHAGNSSRKLQAFLQAVAALLWQQVCLQHTAQPLCHNAAAVLQQRCAAANSTRSASCAV